MPEQTDDKALVTRSLEDPESFGVIVDRFGDRLMRYVRRLGSFSQEDCEDIVQEVFIKAYVGLNGFDTQLSLSSWLYRIAHNQAISFWRKRKVRPEGNAIDIEPDILEKIIGEGETARESEAGLNAEIIAQCIGELDYKYREVLVLRFVETSSYDEISDILEIPPGTVATRINRAKKKLATLLIAKGITEHA